MGWGRGNAGPSCSHERALQQRENTGQKRRPASSLERMGGQRVKPEKWVTRGSKPPEARWLPHPFLPLKIKGMACLVLLRGVGGCSSKRNFPRFEKCL